MELKDMTPYEKLKSLGYATSQEFCLFPTLILDRLVDLPEIVNYQKSVQEHLDYDLLLFLIILVILLILATHKQKSNIIQKTNLRAQI
jgi:hypothetical protein